MVLDEGLVAQVALVRSLTSVQASVQLQARILGKGLGTVGTLVRSVARMPSLMGPQVGDAVEGLFAVQALVRLLLVVGQHMHLERRSVGVRLRADGALKGSLSRMSARVDGELRLGPETSATGVAQMRSLWILLLAVTQDVPGQQLVRLAGQTTFGAQQR